MRKLQQRLAGFLQQTWHHDCGRSCCSGLWTAVPAGRMCWTYVRVSVDRASGVFVTRVWLGVCLVGLAWRGAFLVAAGERALRLCWRRGSAGVFGACAAGSSVGQDWQQQGRPWGWGEGWCENAARQRCGFVRVLVAVLCTDRPRSHGECAGRS